MVTDYKYPARVESSANDFALQSYIHLRLVPKFIAIHELTLICKEEDLNSIFIYRPIFRSNDYNLIEMVFLSALMLLTHGSDPTLI